MIASHKREALLRLKTVRGHIDGVIGMVEREVYCPEIMKQVAALQASLEKITELMEALPYNSGMTDFRHQAAPLPLPGPADGAGAPNGSSEGAQKAPR